MSEHHRGLERAYAAAPITRWMGTAAAVGDGVATVTVPVRPEFLHAAAAVHGSIYFRALDDAAFFAANSVVPDVLVLTASFHVHFFRPVASGTLRAEGRVLHHSRRVVVAEADLLADDGAVLARGSGTFMRSRIALADLPGYAEGRPVAAGPDERSERVGRSRRAPGRMSGSPTTRFGNRVADYVRYRPGYPAGVIDVLRSVLGLAPEDVIADVGAGTGISAALFLDHGHTVYAVEPNRAMREAAEAAVAGRAGFHAINGTAEATTLPAASVDVVVAAQAFHWFDADAARSEFLRILRGEPRVVLLWNTRRTDESAFDAAYEALLVAHGTDYAAVRHDRIDRDRIARFFGGPYEYRTLDNAQELDLAALRGRLLSTSYAPSGGEPGHDAMIEALEEVFRSHARSGTVRMTYDVEVFAGVLR